MSRKVPLNTENLVVSRLFRLSCYLYSTVALRYSSTSDLPVGTFVHIPSCSIVCKHLFLRRQRHCFSTQNASFSVPARLPEPALQICKVQEPPLNAETATVGMPFVPYVPEYAIMLTCTRSLLKILLFVRPKASHAFAAVVPEAVVMIPECVFSVTPVCVLYKYAREILRTAENREFTANRKKSFAERMQYLPANCWPA